MKYIEEIKDKYLIIALVLLQLAITLPFINAYPIDLDEPFSIFYAQQDLSEFIPFLNKGNNPPLHFILLHYWIKLFGISPIAVRSLSLMFSLLTIPILYRFGRELLEKSYTILLVLFFIFSSYNHYQAIEARVYSLFVLLYVIICYLLYKLLFSSKNIGLKLAIANTLLLYAHYLGVFVIGIEVLLLLVFYKKLSYSKIKQLILSFFISLILYTPGLYFFFLRIGEFTQKGTWVLGPKITELYGNVIRFINGKHTFLIMLFFFILLIFLNRRRFKKSFNLFVTNKKHIYIFLAFSLPYFGMYLFSILIQPIFIDRYILFTSPFLYFSIVIIIKFVLYDMQVALAFIFIIPYIFYCNYIPLINRDSNNLVNYIKRDKTKNKCIVIYPPFYKLTFIYHYDKSTFKRYKKVLNNDLNNIQTVFSFKELKINAECETLYFLDIDSKFTYPNNNFERMLSTKYFLLEKKEFLGGYFVYKYKVND